jgi:hypothetical protein
MVTIERPDYSYYSTDIEKDWQSDSEVKQATSSEILMQNLPKIL